MIQARHAPQGGRWHRPLAMAAIMVMIVCGLLPTPLNAAPPTGPKARGSAIKPIVFRDAAGRTVILPSTPKRVVIVGRGPFMALHLIYMFRSASTVLVAVEQRQATMEFAAMLDPHRMKDKVFFKPNPGPEQIVAMKPDLVLIKSSAMENTGALLSKLGIKVAYLGLETQEQFFKDVHNMGLILGEEARAAEIERFYRERLQRLADRLSNIPPADKPRVLILACNERGGKLAMQMPAASWMQTRQALLAGGNPVWLSATRTTDGWTVVGFEQIARWDPDKIFIIPWYRLDTSQVLASLKNDSAWSKLRAVKSGGLAAYPSDIFGWDSPEPRWILGATWMAATLWPERFKDYNLRQEVYDFFGRLYGRDRAWVDAQIMPHLSGGS